MKDKLNIMDILRWHIEAGVDETISNIPQNRFRDVSLTGLTELKKIPLKTATSFTKKVPVVAEILLHDACEVAAAASSVEELKTALFNFNGCALKKTATNMVFGDGNSEAKVVLIGESPGAEEDRRGLPFVGPGGQLLDKMLGSISLDRNKVFLSNIVFWRPPGNRTPTAQEVGLCMPFVERLIELVDPEILIILGGLAAKSMLAKTSGVTRLRGKWYTYSTPRLSRPVQATVLFHPSYLLSSPIHKREAWQDLLMISHKLKNLSLN